MLPNTIQESNIVQSTDITVNQDEDVQEGIDSTTVIIPPNHRAHVDNLTKKMKSDDETAVPSS